MTEQRTTVTWRCNALELEAIALIRKTYRIYSNADVFRFLVEQEREKILSRYTQNCAREYPK